MKTKMLTSSVICLIALLGWGVQPSLADPEHGSPPAHAGEHGGCEKMMEHQT